MTALFGHDVGAALKTLVLLLDLAGTFVFALSGALAGVKHKLDFFGVMVVSFVAGNFGGISRDVMIGALPPAAIADWRFLAASLIAGVLTFFWHPEVGRLHTAVLVSDAAGLGLFAVSGTQTALSFGLNPAMSALLGMVTGIGGGMMRDVLLREVPTVLRSEVYGVAALAGSAAIVIGDRLTTHSAIVAVVAALLCFGLRMLSILRHWNLPTAESSPQENQDE